MSTENSDSDCSFEDEFQLDLEHNADKFRIHCREVATGSGCITKVVLKFKSGAVSSELELCPDEAKDIAEKLEQMAEDCRY